MRVDSSSNSYVQYTPQVMAAQQAAQATQIGIAVQAKAQDAAQVQADALLQMLTSISASMAEGLGQNVDARV